MTSCGPEFPYPCPSSTSTPLCPAGGYQCCTSSNCGGECDLVCHLPGGTDWTPAIVAGTLVVALFAGIEYERHHHRSPRR